MESNRNDIEGRSSATCSPSSDTPETDGEADDAHNVCLDYDCQGKDDNIPTPIVVPADFARRLERKRNELSGYLCRIKLPLPVRFVADLATLFPGKNVRMKDEGGYLCIFSENADVEPPMRKERQ